MVKGSSKWLIALQTSKPSGNSCLASVGVMSGKSCTSSSRSLRKSLERSGALVLVVGGFLNMLQLIARVRVVGD